MTENKTPEKAYSSDRKTSPQLVKKGQWRNFSILAVMLLAVFLTTTFLISENKNASYNKEAEKMAFVSPLSHANDASYWLEKTQNRLSEESKKTENLEEEIAKLNQVKEKNSAEIKEQEEKFSNQISELKKNLSQEKSILNKEGQNSFSTSGNISEDNLKLSSSEVSFGVKNKINKTPENYVPSGTFVKAVMIGGADVSAGVMNQANPLPMLFRVLENGTLPNHQQSHLRDCVVTAAVVGDISSERGEIRLERMSCTFPNGRILDVPVEGTVFGGEGKNGIRGNPVWREGPFLERAAYSGALSGFAQGLAQKYTITSTSPLGNTQSISSNGILQYGLAQGASSAMEKLADYNIKRAEQYHPVIQLNAGALVDIVFLKGFYLEDSQKEEQGNNNEQDNSSFLTLTPAQAQRIKDHERELEPNQNKF
jgi:conjugal transfer pilus assembly protein TraB